MLRLAPALALLLCCAPCALLAEDAPDSNPPAGDELKIMRQMLEQQSKQLDVLAQEIARLNLLLQAKTSTDGSPVPAPAEAPAPALDAPALPSAPPPSAAPAAIGPVHIVTKGETLTAIARHYKITVPELLKVNKIADVRKLQIGQTLTLPPNAKIPASPAPSP